MVTNALWASAVFLAAVAGWTDWRFRRIPNWLTVPGFLVGVVLSTLASGWSGLRESLFGAGLGLALLLPFVLVRSLGAGDWKLTGAFGAFFGPQRLIAVLFAGIIVAGIMAACLIVYKRRVRQTVRNIGRLLLSLVTFKVPARDLSLEDPDALKVPFGLALALAVVAYVAAQYWKVG